jgi:O-antigen/teichoic acid export membrane protein
MLLIVLSPILLLSALCTVPNARLLRSSRLSSFAVGDVLSTLVGIALALYGAFHGWAVWSLAAQQLSLWTLKCAIVTWLSGYRPKIYINFGMIRTRAVFSLLNLGSILVDFLQRNVDNLIIGGLIGVQGLGYYSMSYQIMLMPQTVVALPMSTSVFTSTARAVAAREDVGTLYLTSLEIMTMILAPGMLGLALVADFATVGILGERWAPAASVLALLLPGGFIQCVLQLGNAAVLGVGQGYHRFRLSLLAALPAIVCILIGASFGIRGVAAGLSLGMLASLIPCMVITLRETRVTLAAVIGAVTAPALATAVMGVAVVAFRAAYAPSSPFVALIECGGVGVLTYVIALLAFGRTRSRVLIGTLMARRLPVP